MTMQVTIEQLEASLRPNLEVPWNRARAEGRGANTLVLVGTYDEASPDKPPFFAVMPPDKAAQHLADIQARGLDPRVIPLFQKDIAKKLAEVSSMRLTSAVVAIAHAEGGNEVQFAEGIAPSAIKGTA
jgi:hypothetical protein